MIHRHGQRDGIGRRVATATPATGAGSIPCRWQADLKLRHYQYFRHVADACDLWVQCSMSFSEQPNRFDRRRRRSSGRVAILFGCLGLEACSPPTPASSQLSYSLAPGTIDRTPTSAFGDLLADYPPETNGSPHDFSEGKGVQAFADAMIGKHVADFALQHVVHSVFSGEFHYFYPLTRSGPAPGMCRSRVYSVVRDYDRRVDKPGAPAGAAGEWRDDVFAVAGSVAPLPQPHPQGYVARLNAACRARRDMGIWFSAEPKVAVTAARLADLIIAAARRPGPIPFSLSCRPFPADFREVSRCRANVRQTVASINPRAIVRVDECFEIKQRPCLAVSIAKFPDSASLAEEEQWTLNVQYQDAGLKVARVDVDDTQIIVE